MSTSPSVIATISGFTGADIFRKHPQVASQPVPRSITPSWLLVKKRCLRAPRLAIEQHRPRLLKKDASILPCFTPQLPPPVPLFAARPLPLPFRFGRSRTHGQLIGVTKASSGFKGWMRQSLATLTGLWILTPGCNRSCLPFEVPSVYTRQKVNSHSPLEILFVHSLKLLKDNTPFICLFLQNWRI